MVRKLTKYVFKDSIDSENEMNSFHCGDNKKQNVWSSRKNDIWTIDNNDNRTISE